jgi:hypothetical protein
MTLPDNHALLTSLGKTYPSVVDSTPEPGVE